MATAISGKGYDVVVVGGGVAGLAAVRQATDYGLSVALFEASPLFGGQVATVQSIEGYPSLNPMSGPDLATAMIDDARRNRVVVVEDAVRAIAVDKLGFRVSTESRAVTCRIVVVATGGRHRELDVPGAAPLRGRGVSHCASCDGPLFKDRAVVVVGGGDAALQEAALLAPLCRSVNIIVRNNLRARKKFIDRAKTLKNVKFVWDRTVTAVLGESVVTGVRVRNDEDGTESELPCEGVFPFIGSIPNTEFVQDTLKRSAAGHLLTAAESFMTSQPGIYAVGAVRHGFPGELSCAAGEAAAVIKSIAVTLG
jgi:thioredoxin reductase (NADPH)